MATWGQPSEDTIKLFDDILLSDSHNDLGNLINLKIIINNDQKEVGKLKKLSPEVKFALGDDLLIIVNEIILERLPPVQQNMYIQELLCGVGFNYDNDRMVINAPDVKTFSGFLKKFSYEQYEVMVESIKTLYHVKKEEDAQAKQNAK